jgi:hypothetical protein
MYALLLAMMHTNHNVKRREGRKSRALVELRCNDNAKNEDTKILFLGFYQKEEKKNE